MEQNFIERWGVFELSLPGKAEGNPFTDYTIRGRFTGEQEDVSVSGFYDGDGLWRIRFMPSYAGEYRYTVSGSFSAREWSGSFTVREASEGNHGPVRVAQRYHFSYADGTPFHPLGTTCYVWTQQPDERIAQQKHILESDDLVDQGFFQSGHSRIADDKIIFQKRNVADPGERSCFSIHNENMPPD